MLTAATPPKSIQSNASLPVLLAAFAFLIDLKTPNGLLDGFMYVPAVLVCIWLPAVQAALFAAAGLMLPMIVGYALSPSGVAGSVAMVNRAAAIGVMWLAALAIWRSAKERKATLRALEEMRTLAQAGERDRARMSDWLRQDISLELAMLDWRLNRLTHSGSRVQDIKGEAIFLRRMVRQASRSIYLETLRISGGA